MLDEANRSALFQKIRPPQKVNLEGSQISQIVSNHLATVVSFHAVNGGFGVINVFDSKTLELLSSIKGSEGKRAVGEFLYLQEDYSSGGSRVWYSTADSIVAANVAKYGK